MSKINANIESLRCHILLSNTARKAVTEHVSDEHAFFNLQQYFYVHIEKVAVDEKQHLTFYFDDEKNPKLQAKFPNRVVIIDCVFDQKDGLIAKSFRTRGKGTPVATNRRVPMHIHFVASRISGHTYPAAFTETMQALPVAQERFDYVNKRISSWEGYLKVLAKNAAIEDIQAKFSQPYFNADATHMTVQLQQVDNKQWKQLKGLAVRITGFKQDVGTVTRVQRGEQTVEIELKPDVAKLARKQALTFTSSTIEFSNAATKSQLKRLLKGFDRLKEGLAANANLETILFEDVPNVAARKENKELTFHNRLNEFQRDAVIGAMSAEDLYVIQGPPGTGKTTVISEICYQNAKAGLKTLVASQSNLAVDNALSRLLTNKDIRILRYGRTESIEEEGKKFIEENVASYWRQVTYDTVSYEIDHYESKEQQLKDELHMLEKEVLILTAENDKLVRQIAEKEQAAARLHVLNGKIIDMKKQLAAEKKEREEQEALLARVEEQHQAYASDVQALREALVPIEDEPQLTRQMDVQYELYKALTAEIEAAQLQQQVKQLESRLETVRIDLQKLHEKDAELANLEETIDGLKKVQHVEDFMERYELRRSYVMDRLLTSMERIQPELEQFKGLKETSMRLDKALHYSETKLGIHVEPEPLPIQHTYTLEEVESFLDKLSLAFKEQKVNAINGRRSILGLHFRRAYLQELQTKYDAYIREVLVIFDKFKLEIKKQLQQKAGTDAESKQTLLHQQAQLSEEQAQYALQLRTSAYPSPRALADLQGMRQDADDTRAILQQQLAKRRELTADLTEKEAAFAQLDEQLTHGRTHIETLQASWKAINSTGIAYEKEKVQLEQLVAQHPEQALAQNEATMAAHEARMQKLREQIELIPITEALQTEWKGMLETANEHDLDEIRKLYVKHANVIGTTCVASANKEFMDNYPTFDVVIIDEVSKATPPELLLPMLKGAKIILVGDHHQLPPLVGDETFEETLEEVMKASDTFEEKRELEKLLEESLFERLYKNLPADHKKMLAIQYRMHEDIMASIAPFYAHENDALQCGLEDSDALRHHGIETETIQPSDHLMWLDTPNEAGYFEARVKEGASLYNEAELRIIEEQLVAVNDAIGRQKEQGLFPQDAQKSVGVISFYAEQVKRINYLIEQKIQTPHLHIRTGSVDKFQGMEMDLIFVSMVRNNDNRHGDIGFAKDYRRLNVALSRAKELLVLIGSRDMFTKRPKQQKTREMYTRLYETVQAQQGHRAYAFASGGQ